MFVANIDDYLEQASGSRTTADMSSSIGDHVSFAPVSKAAESNLPDANVMLVCFFIAVLLIFLLISAAYALFFYLKEENCTLSRGGLYASDTTTTFSSRRSPVDLAMVEDNDESQNPPNKKSMFQTVVTGLEAALRSIVTRFFRKKVTESDDTVWHTGIDQDVQEFPMLDIDVAALQTAVSLEDEDRDVAALQTAVSLEDEDRDVAALQTAVPPDDEDRFTLNEWVLTVDDG